VIEGHWLSVRRNDARAFGLWRRHYSAEKNWRLLVGWCLASVAVALGVGRWFRYLRG